MTGTEVDRVEHHGVRDARALRRRPRAARRAAPRRRPADGLHRRHRRRRASRRSSAARRTSPPGRPSPSRGPARSCPTARSSRRPSCAASGVRRDDPRRGRARHRHRPRRDDRARRRRSQPGTPLAGVLPIATDVLELEITPNRPDCLGVYGVAREVHAATGARAGAAAVGRRPGRRLGRRRRRRRGRRRGARPVPALHRARVRGRDDRPVAAVAEGAPDGLPASARSTTSSTSRTTSMLLTGQPLHAFDLDRIAGAPARRAPRHATASRSSRSTARRARSTPTSASSPTPTGRRRSPASWAATRSEVQADTTRVLMEVANWDGAEHPRDVAEARPAQRGQRALREGPRRPSRRSRRRPSRRSSCSS